MNHSLFIHLLKSTLVASKFWHLYIKLPKTSTYRFCVDVSFSLLECMVKVCSIQNHLSEWLYCVVFPVTVNENSFCSLSSPAFVVSVLDFDYSTRCVVVAHSCFSLHFPSDTCGTSFPYACHLYVFLGKLSRSFAHFKIGFFIFLWLGFKSSSYILDYSPLSEMAFADIFSPCVVQLSFSCFLKS